MSLSASRLPGAGSSCLFAVVLVVASCASANEGRLDTDTIWIDRTLYFSTDEGLVEIQPGAHRLESLGEGRLGLVRCDTGDRVLLTGETTNHGETLDAPSAWRELVPDTGAMRIVLLLPDRTAVVAAGSPDRARTRNLTTGTPILTRGPDVLVSALTVTPAAPTTEDPLTAQVTVRNGGGAECSTPSLLLQALRGDGQVLYSTTRSLPSMLSGAWRNETFVVPALPAASARIRATVTASKDADPSNNVRDDDRLLAPGAGSP